MRPGGAGGSSGPAGRSRARGKAAGTGGAATFHVDLERERLWRGSEDVPLQPRALGVLCALLRRAGEIVSREEIEGAVWPDVQVSPAMLRYCIRQVRRALEAGAAPPGLVETVPRRGWRFTGRLRPGVGGVWHFGAPEPAPAGRAPRPRFVGRAREVERLRRALERAEGGERQVCLVTGEAGIGKTALIEAFLATPPASAIAVGHAECAQHYGPGEAYRPALEALERVCFRIGGAEPIEALRRHAPMWLVNLPSLTGPEERLALRRGWRAWRGAAA